MNVTLFQASAENSDPTMATPTSRTACMVQPAPSQKWPKLRVRAAGLRPSRNPMATSPNSAAVLANVKTFCTIAPVRMPRIFTAVSSPTIAIPTSCCVVSPAFPLPIKWFCAEIHGTKTPANLAKATATAAMVPVWITRNSVQP